MVVKRFRVSHVVTAVSICIAIVSLFIAWRSLHERDNCLQREKVALAVIKMGQV
jgi:hypothetical protein